MSSLRMPGRLGGRFECGVLRVLGAGVSCLYALGAAFFAMPVEGSTPLSYELAVEGPDRRFRDISAPTGTTSAPAGRSLPALEIALRPPATGPRREIEAGGVALRVASAGDLDRKLAALDYSLGDVRRGGASVPRLRLASLPPDLARLNSVERRKRLFVQSMLPLILQANEEIFADRRRLLRLLDSRGGLSREDEAWIVALADRYDADPSNPSDLAGRVDAVPPSLAIAQGAEESGWGTSRFAIKANAIFGQWTFREGSGMVPRRRDAGKRHEVRSFEELRQSVSAYMHNLNIHPAYEEFRRARQELRKSGMAMTGKRLVGTLDRYSERGSDYIKTLRTIMRVNDLGAFDRARLRGPGRAGLGT